MAGPPSSSSTRPGSYWRTSLSARSWRNGCEHCARRTPRSCSPLRASAKSPTRLIATSFWNLVRPSSICPTPRPRNPQTRELYRKFGLSDRQIDIIAEATPKRDYYYVSPLGRRLFQFALGPAALAFIGAGSKEDVLAARRMIAEHGERWRVEWLRARGLGEWADYLDSLLHARTPAPIIHHADGYLNGHDTHAEATGMSSGGQGDAQALL